MSAIEKYIPEDSEIERVQRIATNFANSGYFSDAKEALQAFVKISAGAEMGLQPFVSMSGIAIIQGKPVVGAGILAGLLDDHPDFDYTVTWEPNPSEPTACTVTVFKNGKERGASRFSMKDAESAGLAGKDVWKKFQRNMLYARAMSNAVAWYAPSVTRSNGRVYVEGELDDAIDVRPEPAPRRKREARTAATTVPPNDETVIEAEVVPADPVVATTAEDTPVAVPESETSAGTTPIALAKAAYAACSKDEKAAVKDACKQLGMEFSATNLVDRFGADAYSRETLLPALAAAVSPPERIEGEIDTTGADEFQQHLDAERAAAAEENIAGADSARERISERLAAAGQYGE